MKKKLFILLFGSLLSGCFQVSNELEKLKIFPLDHHCHDAFEGIEFKNYNYNNGNLILMANGFRLGGKSCLIDQKTLFDQGNHFNISINDSIKLRSAFNKINLSLKDGEFKIIAAPNSDQFLGAKESNSIFSRTFTIRNGSAIRSNTLDIPYILINSPNDGLVESSGKSILLDFSMINTNIDTAGNFIEIKINNTTLSNKIYKYESYLIEGLESGKYKLDLQIKNKFGQVISDIFSRSFELK